MPKKKYTNPKISVRNSKGQFTKFDRRKYMFDGRGKLLYVPKVGFVVEKYSAFDKPTYKKPKKKSFLPSIFNLGSITLYPPTLDLHFDLYDFLKVENVDTIIDGFKLEYPNSVITAQVNLTIGTNHYYIREFKVTNFQAEFLHSSKNRKGNNYNGSDAIAYFINQQVNEETEYTMYEYRTDIDIQVEDKERKRRRKNAKKYEKEIRIEINFNAISNRLSRELPSVGQSSEVVKKAKRTKRKNN